MHVVPAEIVVILAQALFDGRRHVGCKVARAQLLEAGRVHQLQGFLVGPEETLVVKIEYPERCVETIVERRNEFWIDLAFGIVMRGRNVLFFRLLPRIP